jgi:cytochrome c peroxidase
MSQKLRCQAVCWLCGILAAAIAMFLSRPVFAVEAPSVSKAMLGPGSGLTKGIPGSGPLKLAEIEAWLANPANHVTLQIVLPLGVDQAAAAVVGLDKNPLTRAKIELGRQLYFDSRLSADGTVSCASCHHPSDSFARQTQFGEGIKGQKGGRNSPVSFNRIFSGAQFWDGRAATLEEQAKGPIQNPIEMGHTHEAVIAALQKIPGYVKQFESIFPDGVNIDNVALAIASFERTLVTGPSAYDYFAEAERLGKVDPDELKDDAALAAKVAASKAAAAAHPMSDSAKRGRDLFFSQKANCTACHAGANFTDEKYHNIGVGMDAEKPDIGREEQTKDPKDHGAFKTPTVRNCALTGPYMHDGSQKTLAEVIEWYAKGGHSNPALSDKIKKLDLTEQDKKDLTLFLEALTGEFPAVEQGRLPE